MKQIQKWLAHYSLILSSIIAVWALIALEKPLGFVIFLLFFPLCLYFWISSGLIKHSGINQLNQSPAPLILLAIALSSLLSLGFSFLSNHQIQNLPNPDQKINFLEFKSELNTLEQQNSADLTKLNKQMVQEFQDITSRLSAIEAKQEIDTTEVIKSVSLTKKDSEEPVFENADENSKTIAIMKSGQAHLLLEKNNKWAKIAINGKFGYINIDKIKETNN